MVFIILLLFGLAVIIIGVIQTQKKNKFKQEAAERRKIKAAEYYARVEEERKRKIDEYNAISEPLITQYGTPDRVLAWGEYDINEEVRVYIDQKKLILLGKVYSFSDIITFSIEDKSKVKKGETTISTTSSETTSNGSMLGRAAVGGLLAGGVGAVIGGATAKKNTETTNIVNTRPDRIIHDYYVNINTKDILNPLIIIHVGSESKTTNEIVALLNAVVANR